jgi:methylthioribose-1-phosphate isomerase
MIDPVVWRGDAVAILDQRALPHRETTLLCTTVDAVSEAIRTLAVSGSPAIGVAAAYGMALAATTSSAGERDALLQDLAGAARMLAATRPTAVNLSWAVERVLHAASADDVDARDAAVREAIAIESEDRAACEAMGRHGLDLIPEGADVLTHCNTGMLCSAGIGTALGVVITAHQAGRGVHVWVDETRPLWQGARLTAWELGRLGIPRTLVVDGAAASLMARGQVDLVITGADRIAADGSVANKIGTYGLAVLAREHGIPFIVAAPTSTVDLSTPTGDRIRIEERDPGEVLSPLGVQVAEAGTPVANPAFDVTPGRLIHALVTERGVVPRPNVSSLRAHVGAAAGAPLA